MYPPLPESCAAAPLRARIVRIFGGLIAFNLAVWAYSLWAFRAHPVLLGSAALAYTLGLRHAVDADHIAAIDNVTRKLMQRGERPVAVGLFFSLGHSSVVVLAFIALALMARDTELMRFKAVANVIGTGASAVFLFAIALANSFSLVETARSFRRARSGSPCREEDLDLLLVGGGLPSRLFRPAFALIGRSRDMYLLGALFGLGFDTASEIAVLGLSAVGVAQGATLWSLLALPALFTAGMTLVDTADNVLMLGAYGWAFVKPVRKLYYNLIITLMSVLIAVVIGGVEVLGLIGQGLGSARGPWHAIAALDNAFGTLGYLVLGIFMASWIVSALLYRLLGHDRIEVPDASSG